MSHPTDNETPEPALVPKGGVEALRPYFGKWVALDADGAVVGSGSDSGEAYDCAVAAGVEEPTLMFVPRTRVIGHAAQA